MLGSRDCLTPPYRLTPLILAPLTSMGIALLSLVVVFVVWATVPLAALAESPPARLAQSDYSSIDQFIDERLKSERIPGAAIAFLDGFGIVHERGFGRADRSGMAMTEHTPSALGSLSKSFTAIAVMQLVDEGRVALVAPAANYVSELDSASDPRISKVTVRQLLNHTSGFSTYDGNFGQADFSQQPDALDKAVNGLLARGLVTDPGTRFEYSNGNYQILGLLLERIDGVAYEVSVKRRILDVVGMQSSFVLAPADDDPPHAEPFRFWWRWPVFFDKPTGRTIVAQGGVYSSAHDISLYMLDLVSDQPKLLSTKSRDELFVLAEEGSDSGYGLGWFIERYENHRLIFHGGANPGYETIAGFVPEQGRGFVLLVNAGTGFLGGNVAGLIESVKDRALAQHNGGHAPPGSNVGIVVSLLALVAVLLFLTARWILRLYQSASAASSLKERWSALRLFGPTVVLCGLGYAFLFAIPKAFHVPLPGLIAFAPDVGLLLATTGVLSLVVVVLRTFYLLRQWSKTGRI